MSTHVLFYFDKFRLKKLLINLILNSGTTGYVVEDLLFYPAFE